MVAGIPNSLIMTRFSTARVNTAINPKAKLNKPSRNTVSIPTLRGGLIGIGDWE
jgi:hypothetical protein